MKSFIKRVRKVAASNITAVKVAGTTFALAIAPATNAFASEAGSSGIKVDFDTSQMFTFANVIIESLMPVVYITAGLGIGFLIINSLKNAFR